jgi:hypothetical protein
MTYASRADSILFWWAAVPATEPAHQHLTSQAECPECGFKASSVKRKHVGPAKHSWVRNGKVAKGDTAPVMVKALDAWICSCCNRKNFPARTQLGITPTPQFVLDPSRRNLKKRLV